jgi:hypothetical protein
VALRGGESSHDGECECFLSLSLSCRARTRTPSLFFTRALIFFKRTKLRVCLSFYDYKFSHHLLFFSLSPRSSSITINNNKTISNINNNNNTDK